MLAPSEPVAKEVCIALYSDRGDHCSVYGGCKIVSVRPNGATSLEEWQAKMNDLCDLILQTIFTHDEKSITELARLTGQPGCVEAQAAVYAATCGNRRETMEYAFQAVYGRAEGFHRDGEVACREARHRHMHLMLDEGYKFIQ